MHIDHGVHMAAERCGTFINLPRKGILSLPGDEQRREQIRIMIDEDRAVLQKYPLPLF